MIHGAAMSFSPDYVTARAKLRKAAESLGWTHNAYSLGATGPQGEDLTIDVVASSPPRTGPVLVISSGLHGVEGVFGSAVQLELLNRWGRDKHPPEGIRCVMLHALNPFGFAWSRRVDGENIDPNRNFLLDGDNYRGSSETFARLDGFLNSRLPPSRWFDMFYPNALRALVRYGKPALKEAIVAGQYDFPKGLFFGGHAASGTKKVLQRHMRSWLGAPSSVVHLDFHTGLGKWGTYKLLSDAPPNNEQLNWILRTFGSDTYEQNSSRGIAYRSRGSFERWCLAQGFSRQYFFAYAEFGTYSNLRILAGLRAENRAHHWAGENDLFTLRAKKQLRELFCPESAKWRRRGLAQGVDLVEKVLEGLAAGTPDYPCFP